jgi:hypothetical protein
MVNIVVEWALACLQVLRRGLQDFLYCRLVVELVVRVLALPSQHTQPLLLLRFLDAAD